MYRRMLLEFLQGDIKKILQQESIQQRKQYQSNCDISELTEGIFPPLIKCHSIYWDGHGLTVELTVHEYQTVSLVETGIYLT